MKGGRYANYYFAPKAFGIKWMKSEIQEKALDNRGDEWWRLWRVEDTRLESGAGRSAKRNAETRRTERKARILESRGYS